MSRTIVLTLVGIAALGVVIAIAMRHSARTVPAVSSLSSTTPVETDLRSTVPQGTVKKSLAALVSAKDPVVCDYATSTPKVRASGIVYAAGGKMRADVVMHQISPSPLDAELHLAYDGSALYLWTPLLKENLKVVGPLTQLVSTSTNPSFNVTWAKDAQYSCKSWNMDASVFTPPAGIQFVDLQQRFQQYYHPQNR